MTIDRSLEDALPAILADLGAGPAPDYVDLILRRTDLARQRPGWAVPSRWLPRIVTPQITGPRLRPAYALILLALALGATAVYIGTRPRLPAPFGPAHNGALVFGSGGDIYTGAPGGERTAIVSGLDVDFGPFYSPNGTRIAFYRQFGEVNGAATDIMVVNADGTGLTRITQRPLSEIPWSASWTADSSRIVVQTSQRLDGRLLSFDASQAAEPVPVDQAAHDLGLRIDSFAFQPPHGDRILISGQSGSKIGLFTMAADGTDLTTLIKPYLAVLAQNSRDFWNLGTDVSDLRSPVWSPDGKHIVVQQYEVTAQAWQMHLFMLDADGGNIHAITTPVGNSLDGSPLWSPDGTRIAFLRYDLSQGVWTYAVLRLADGTVTPTGPPIPDGYDHDDWSPGVPIITWSPDSTRLFAVERAGARQAYILDPEGGPFQTQPWHVETPQSWGLQGLNGFDLGSWQRVAGP